MKFFFFFLFLIPVFSFSQNDPAVYVDAAGDTIPVGKWPWVDQHTPPFFGFTLGYNFYHDKFLEAGVIFNVGDNSASFKNSGGSVLGPSFNFKRDFEKNINSIAFDLGFYALAAFGLGVNYNFSDKEHLMAFRPFIGIYYCNFQVNYGYNFFSRYKNEKLGLYHNSFEIKLTIPVVKIFKDENL